MKTIIKLLTLAALLVSSALGQVQNVQAGSGTTGDLTKPSAGIGIPSGYTLTVKSGGAITINSGGTFTQNGTADFSSATTFKIPNSAAPTTSTFGSIAGDNNAWASGRGAVQVYDGTANTYLIGALASDTPTNGQVPTWNTGGTITWETSSSASGANPTGTIGLSAVNGVATTFLRSDGAPALSQGITPTWSGAHVFAANATLGAASGTTGALTFKGTTSGTFVMSVNDAAGSWTAKWPATAGSNTNVLTTDGSGNLSWSAGGGGSGTVNSGTATQFAYYPASAAAVSSTPTLTVSAAGQLTMTPTAIATGVTSYLTITTPTDTGLTASTEAIGARLSTGTRTWATTGTVPLQREVFFGGPTYASASASQTFTDVFTVGVSPPIAGTNVIFTRKHTLGVIDSTSAASSITGGLIVAATAGTSATSVGIGGGNVMAGGTVGAAILGDTSGNEIFILTATASAVNEITVANAAASSSPTLTASGSDTNIDINLTPKGTGGIVLPGNVNAPTLRVGSIEIQSYTSANCAFGGNLYFDGTNTKYRTTNAGSYIQFNAGAIFFRTAPSGSAGATATVTTQINLALNGDTTFASTTQATSTTAGSVMLAGGLSVVGNIYGGGVTVLTPVARASGTAVYFSVTTPTDTGITASTEAIGLRLLTGTRTWATTGTVTLQREVNFGGPTYASAGASQTFTDVFTVGMSPPVQGTNAIFTRTHTLGIIDATSAASSITGGLIVAATVGTAATSVGIGGGNVYAGGSVSTGAPSGGTAAPWKFGVVASVTPTLPNRTIEIEVSGTRYFLAAKTTND